MNNTININAIAHLFIDSLAGNIPLKAEYTYKELDQFCRREGITELSEISPKVLKAIATKIGHLTQGHLTFTSKPIKQARRYPLSLVDATISELPETEHTAALPETFKTGCRVFLKTGYAGNIVDQRGENYIGMSDTFKLFSFTHDDVHAAFNMDEPFSKIAHACPNCGDDLNLGGCGVCSMGVL